MPKRVTTKGSFTLEHSGADAAFIHAGLTTRYRKESF